MQFILNTFVFPSPTDSFVYQVALWKSTSIHVSALQGPKKFSLPEENGGVWHHYYHPVDPPPSAFCLRACHYYSDQQAMRPSFSYDDFTSGHKSAKQCRCSDSRCKLFGARTPERLPSLPPSPVVPFVNLHCLSFHSIGTKHLEWAMIMSHESSPILTFYS